MKRVYRLRLCVGDQDDQCVFDDTSTFTTFDDDTTTGEIDVHEQLRRMLAAMNAEYFEAERKRRDYWESQIRLCEKRLKLNLPIYRRRCLEGALETYRTILKEFEEATE